MEPPHIPLGERNNSKRIMVKHLVDMLVVVALLEDETRVQKNLDIT